MTKIEYKQELELANYRYKMEKTLLNIFFDIDTDELLAEWQDFITTLCHEKVKLVKSQKSASYAEQMAASVQIDLWQSPDTDKQCSVLL